MLTYALTDVGRHRAVNQDAAFCSGQSVGRLPNLFIVADGMGGHRGGDYASSFAVRRMTEILGQEKEPENPSPALLLKYAVNQVNVELFREASVNQEYSGMGTTMVACTIDQDRITVANVGDSRLYVCGSGLNQITRDHSLVEEMVQEGTLEKGSTGYLKNKNIITRAVGVEEKVDVDIFYARLDQGQRILMCSDGLTNMVEDSQIERILKEENDIRMAVERLVSQANVNGGQDNIAVILIDPEYRPIS